MRLRIWTMLMLGALSFAVVGCGSDGGGGGDAGEETGETDGETGETDGETGDETGDPVACVGYEEDILPLVNSFCAPCHTSGSSGGVNFTTYEGVIALNKGEPVYWRMVARAVETDSMPAGGNPPLSPENKDLILSWAEQDAPESCE